MLMFIMVLFTTQCQPAIVECWPQKKFFTGIQNSLMVNLLNSNYVQYSTSRNLSMIAYIIKIKKSKFVNIYSVNLANLSRVAKLNSVYNSILQGNLSIEETYECGVIFTGIFISKRWIKFCHHLSYILYDVQSDMRVTKPL